MAWRSFFLACIVSHFAVICAKKDPPSFEVPYSEAWQEQILERGKEFTAEHRLSPEDFDTIVLDSNGAKVKRGQKPDADNFPLRVKFVPKRKEGDAPPKTTFTMEYSEIWKEEMSKQMKKFGEEHDAKPENIGVSVVDVKGENVKHDENPAADRFPIKIAFQLPPPKPAAKPDQRAPRLDAKGGPKGFKLDYSDDWKTVMGQKMMKFGKMYGVSPDKFWPKITDKMGADVETGADIVEGRFPLDISFVPREAKPPMPAQDGEGGPPAGGQMVDMSLDIRCDFCELAAKRISSSLTTGASFKRSDDILAKLEDFCDGRDGEDDIGTTLLKQQHFVFWNSTLPKDDGTLGRWNLMNIPEGSLDEGEKIEDMVDPQFKEGMQAGIKSACEKTVDEHQVELSEKLFKALKKSKVVDEAAVRKMLCVGLSRVCPKDEDDAHTMHAEKRTDL